jgi:hypothetical protein
MRMCDLGLRPDIQFGESRKMLPGLIRCCPECELRNGDAEQLSLLALHKIGPLHASLQSLQNAVAIVFVMSAGRYDRLLTDNSFALDLLNPTRGMPDEPLSPKQLNSMKGLILDSNEVCEDKLALQNV